MQSLRCGVVFHRFSLIAVFTALVAATSYAQMPSGVVPVSAEPDHKMRFENGKVRVYEVELPKGRSTMMHEHKADSFSVMINDSALIYQFLGKETIPFTVMAGSVNFAPTTLGPYVHRIEGNADTPFRVMAIELLNAPSPSANKVKRASPPFAVSLENYRGRAYRMALKPGESTEQFARPANTAIFSISSGRISETVEGKQPRIVDFEPANFRWIDSPEKLSIRNEGTARIELVEIEIY